MSPSTYRHPQMKEITSRAFNLLYLAFFGPSLNELYHSFHQKSKFIPYEQGFSFLFFLFNFLTLPRRLDQIPAQNLIFKSNLAKSDWIWKFNFYCYLCFSLGDSPTHFLRQNFTRVRQRRIFSWWVLSNNKLTKHSSSDPTDGDNELHRYGDFCSFTFSPCMWNSPWCQSDELSSFLRGKRLFHLNTGF